MRIINEDDFIFLCFFSSAFASSYFAYIVHIAHINIVIKNKSSVPRRGPSKKGVQKYIKTSHCSRVLSRLFLPILSLEQTEGYFLPHFYGISLREILAVQDLVLSLFSSSLELVFMCSG